MRSGQRRLAAAAASIRPCSGSLVDTVTVNILTGTRYWDQSVACLLTLNKASGLTFPLRVLDDGSLTQAQADVLRRLSPTVAFQTERESLMRLSDLLPESRFPVMHRLWREYKHIRKLTDAHVGRTGVNLVLDSDMLFHRLPEELISYLKRPVDAIAMRDCQESYGYPRGVLQSLLDGDLPHEVNVGLVALRSESIDWARIEFWADSLIAAHGRSYFLEQALIALMLGEMPHRILPMASYRVIAEYDGAVERVASLVHYVHASKRQYFDRDWKSLLS